jgi:histidyl-tRNA synthetase
VVEEGTHDGLVAAGGRYATLWSAWQSRQPTPPDQGAGPNCSGRGVSGALSTGDFL